jgi:uncharacterized protein
MPAILLFLKAPRKGYVKTRLADTIGSKQALTIYQALVERQLNQLPEDECVEIHHTPCDAEAEMKQWLGDDYSYYPRWRAI